MIIRNIEAKIRLAAWLSAGSFICAVLVAAIACFFAWKQVTLARKSIYVLDGANIPVMAAQTDVEVNRPAEYKAHIQRFHTLFFSLSPDDKYIEYQMKQAMYLVDESGALQYNNLREKGYFNSILSSSAVLTIRTDSIILDPARKYFRYYGKQKIDRRSSSLIRSLVTEGYLKDLEMRSENNPHAILITRWKTLENKDIESHEKNDL